MKTKLPNKLSDLLELAVNDALTCEADPRFELDMTAWVEPDLDGVCHVCLGGAVLANTCQITTRKEYRHIGLTLRRKASAINCMRMGDFVGAAWSLGLPLPSGDLLNKLADLVEREYDDIGRAPWCVYLECVDKLREVGL